MLEINLNAIPHELRPLANWVCWKIVIRDGKRTKVPVNPKTGGNAQSDRPETWGLLQEALDHRTARNGNGVQGIGFMFSNSPFCGIDLDGCRDPQTGDIEAEAAAIVAEMCSYTEITPSGKGLHILVRGALPVGRRKKGRFEMYDSGRFFTITGDHLKGTPATIEARENELAGLHSRIFAGPPGKQNPPAQLAPPDLSDSDLTEKAQRAGNGGKFSRLWFGDWSEYPSQSEADLALCSMLAFWTGRDAVRIDRLFRQSGLIREKWDERRGEKTYGEITIRRAIEQTTEVYSPNGPDCQPGPPAAMAIIEIGINLTDLGNARRLVAAHGRDLRFCFPCGKWLAWNGARWRIDDSGEVERRAKDTIRLIYQEAAEAGDDNRRKSIAKHAWRSEGQARVKAMIDLARSEPGIPILPEAMDWDPWAFNVKNGTVNLKTGELQPHDPADLITRIAPVKFLPGAKCPFWLKHLEQIFAGNAAMISFLQLAFGYSLTALTDERVTFIAYGSGANGKTTTHEVIAQISGDYAVRTPTESILVKREGAIPNDVARLRGARFVFCSEAEEGKRLAESMIKDLTGGDTISARFMRGEWFEFQPTFKIWVATNHKPVIRGTDNAIWDRIRLIPFNVSIPQAERFPKSRLMEMITPELPGILAWVVNGCLEWRRYGLLPPEEVKEATNEYRAESDLVGAFISERCIESPKYQTPAKELYEDYVRWAESNGEHAVSQRKFGSRLSERGFRRERMTGGRYRWTGIGLLAKEVNDSEPSFNINKQFSFS